MTVEQGDLFIETARTTEEDLQRQHDKETTQKFLTPRQWALYRLIRRNSLEQGRKTTIKEICDTLPEYYQYNRELTAHDPCPAVWKDITALRKSYSVDKIIISDNFTYWIGDQQETTDFINGLWDDLFPRLSRYWAYKRKLSRNGQGKLLSNQLEVIDNESQAREFIESYNTRKVSE